MSRIRSTHPGVWTDERFVSVSAFARLLFMGIWNECDDYGSFEWSPLKLKMRVLPADMVDAAQLLDELHTAGSVMRYEVGGKQYGAVRNFCQYQRPKKPTHVHPQNDVVEAWVNIDARSTRDGSEGVGDELPTGGENLCQRKEEGGKGRPASGKPKAGEARKRAKQPFELPDWVDREAWGEFETHRKSMRNVPFGDSAKKSTVDDLARLKAEGHDPAKLLRKAVKLGWRGVFAGDDTRASAGQNGQRPMNRHELQAAIAFAEDNGDPDRAAELKRQLKALSERPPDPAVAAIVARTTQRLHA